METLDEFEEIWAVDFEFSAPHGSAPVPVCMVARELRRGTTIRLWQNDLQTRRECPFDVSARSLVVAYFVTAELSCFLALGWRLPESVLDLYVEFRNTTNGLELPFGKSLLGALAFFGVAGTAFEEKQSMRELALRGGPWTESEQRALLEYCESDVDALEQLLPRMMRALDIDRALLRGRYMVAMAQIESRGVPIDHPGWRVLVENWNAVQEVLVTKLAEETGVYDGLTFKRQHFEGWCQRERIEWPRLDSGALALDDDTFREQERMHPSVAPIRDLRRLLAQLRAPDLSVGPDGRNRVMLSPFGSKTGRNQPSTSRFIFGCPVWFRSLIQPPPGRAIAYIDWEQQEFAIAAALSGDANMRAACESGDPYLAFAKQAGAVPTNATKATHAEQRELFKLCALGVLYGMSDAGLARRIGQHVESARQLLRLHRRTFPDFWEWQDAVLDHARLRGSVHTVLGWRLLVGSHMNDRSIRNFPMQANGAEMLRVACCLTVENGVQVCAPVHDALLIEADEREIDEAVRVTRGLMADASAIVLDGFRLRTDAKVFRFPERFIDPRGERMWKLASAAMLDLGLVREGGRGCNSARAPVPTRSISFEGSEQ